MSTPPASTTAFAHGVRIAGTGSAVPAQVLSNRDFEKFLDTSDEWIQQRTGIRERRVCDPLTEGTFTLSRDALARALEAAKMKASELDLIIVTGRPPRWISPIVEMTGHRGVGIAANGAVVLDLADGHVTEVFPMSGDIALEAVDRLRQEVPGMVFAVERARPGGKLAPTGGASYDALDATLADATEFALADGYTPRWPVPPETHVGPIEELVAAGDVVKILARPGKGAPMDPEELYARGLRAVGPLERLQLKSTLTLEPDNGAARTSP